MKEITLTQGKTAMVDDGDYEFLSKLEWYALYCHGTWYAARDLSHGVHVYMHELLCEKRQDRFIDHKDHNGLNNQRGNLRECTQSLNNANARKRKNTSSEFKGVSFDKERGLWIAQLTYRRVKFLHRRFSSEVAAAIAYNEAASAVFGEFATLNDVSLRLVG